MGLTEREMRPRSYCPIVLLSHGPARTVGQQEYTRPNQIADAPVSPVRTRITSESCDTKILPSPT
jgi:hypothetical protein